MRKDLRKNRGSSHAFDLEKRRGKRDLCTTTAPKKANSREAESCSESTDAGG